MKLNMQGMALCAAIVLVMASTGYGASAAPSSKVPAVSPERGQQLAIKLCSNCHALDNKTEGAQSAAGAVSFVTAANRPGQTSERLEGYMLEPPHPAMPEAPLSRDQIRDVAAYILTLRKP